MGLLAPLHPCPTCRRHVRGDAGCPFCGSRALSTTAAVALFGVVTAGCPADDMHIDDASTGFDDGKTTSTSLVTLGSSGNEGGDGHSGVFDTGTADASSDEWLDDEGCAFYGGCPSDGGGVNIECDIWAQDCPVGEKCMPWANDGGSSWNATKCSPLSRDADAPGDHCTVEGSGVSGIDSCEIAAMCWDVDARTNEGTCVAFCGGSEAEPTCTDPATQCIITSESVLVLCLPICDPLAQDCVEGQGCYPIGDAFACVPDGGAEIGAFGEPCDFLNVCDPGLFCGNPAGVPECASIGCCTEFCDLLAPEPDLQCSGQRQGQACVPWYADGQAPPGLEGVGACLITT